MAIDERAQQQSAPQQETANSGARANESAYFDSKERPLSPPPPMNHNEAVSTEKESIFSEGNYKTDSKIRPMSPAMSHYNEMTSPGLESLHHEDSQKEVYGPDVHNHKYYVPQSGAADSPPKYVIDHNAAEPEKSQKRRICGLPKKLFYILLVLLLCLIIGLAVGLGVGLSRKSSSSKSTTQSAAPIANAEYDIGGILNASYYSTDMAFNGTGIALASQSFGSGGYGEINVYFQHYTGTIRSAQLQNDGSWLGGTISNVIADDARNGTALSAVAYALNDTATWHLFYVQNETNLVRQKTNSNLTNTWADGPLNDLNITASNTSQTGLQACWFGNFYGNADYTHSPTYNPNNGSANGSDGTTGISFFVGDTETSFQQYGWLHGSDTWERQEHWPNLNSQAGVGCYTWGPGTVQYVFMLDLANTMSIFWKDTNSTLNSTASHPVNKWTNSSLAINDLHPSSSLGYTNYLYAQQADEMIHGWNVTFAAENTSFVQGDDFTVEGDPGIPGTHLSVTSLPNESGGYNIQTYYQTKGDDITFYTRDLLGGEWSGSTVPIPDQ